MIITFTIQEIETREILFSDALQTLNRTELINFLNVLEDLDHQENESLNTYLFYLEEGEEIFFERYLNSIEQANTIKNSILDFVASGALSFDGPKQIKY